MDNSGFNSIGGLSRSLGQEGFGTRYAYPKDETLIIEGINFIKRHARATRQARQAGVIELEAPVHISTVMLLCDKCNRSSRIGFRFLEAQALDAQLSPVMRETFNRRRTVRVVPDPRRPVTVELRTEPGAPPLEVGLVNVSETGVAISLDAGQDSRFADTTALLVTLYLPDSRRPVSLMGNIRYRRLVAEQLHYGIDFDPEASRDFARKQAAITKYVLKHQLKTLRQSA